jgi:NADH-quinone oxidoreductase subunit L
MTGIPLYLTIILSPLVASTIVGLFGFAIGKKASHILTILGVLISTVCSYILLNQVLNNGLTYDGDLYTWLSVGNQKFSVGILVDSLTATMLTVVTSVSLMVHIYTIGYMKDEDGYSRFFSYISLFTFMMIMLVMSNNFIQLFFGWEGVGLVSYLLIGFYFKKESATFANLKAFLVNRIGDLGFLLGIGLVLYYFGTLNYAEVFAKLNTITGVTFLNTGWSAITVICMLLFVGAMGKSAQFPLHVWLPDSMEGPTPISALIHAATMVTAGIFMVARLSPMYNLSPSTLSFIAIIGGINALFLGMLGLIQNDIKRVVAYSTLSQLGYMAVALGCGAYTVGIFHLMTHAFFKALLFLAAGSVIVAMHHEQDMRKMGGLWKYMPITYVVTIIGNLALAGIPPFAGFFSKDMILDAANNFHEHGMFGGSFVVFCVYAGVFVTACYSFRQLFMTFHGKERFREEHHDDAHDAHGHDDHHHAVEPKESPLVITLPLILLAIPSVIIGWLAFDKFVPGEFFHNVVFNADFYAKALEEDPVNPISMLIHSVTTLPVYLALSGILAAFIAHKSASFVKVVKTVFKPFIFVMERKYFMDDLFINLLAPMARGLGKILWSIGDVLLIDGLVVNGSARVIAFFAKVFRRAQTGYVNSAATYMVLGILILLTFCTSLILR